VTDHALTYPVVKAVLAMLSLLLKWRGLIVVLGLAAGSSVFPQGC